MSNSVQNVAPKSGIPTAQSPRNNDPRTAAQTILAETRGKPATYDRLGQIEARIDAIARTDPEFAAQVRKEIMASPNLSATDKGTLRRNEPGTTVDLDGKLTDRTVNSGGVSWDKWINSQRKANTPEYKALVKLAGSAANGPIKAVLSELHNRGMNADQLATARLNEAELARTSALSGATLTVDLLQMTLDLTGIVDPTPISDGSNAVISLGRSLSAAFSGEWSKAGGHLANGAISVVGFVPLLGDLAKAGKIGKWAQTVANAIEMAAKNPELAKKIEPALREIRDLVDKIPQSALDALPADARASLTKMKAQLDELFGAAGKKVDDVAAKLAEVYKLAPAAKKQIDALSDEIAAKFGGKVAKAPIKGEARALEKAIEYGGDVSRIKDLARNTIIVRGDKIDDVVLELQKSGAQIKRIDGRTDPLGYSGINATIKTETGLIAEIQVNSPKMIFAKESPANARAILGEAAYNKVAKEVGILGGQGHKLYEQYRSLPQDHPDRKVIEQASRAYYDKFR